jgi:stage II sporulation protein R
MVLKKLKNLVLAFSISLAVLGAYVTATTTISAKIAQKHIAENVLRFHVVANSDSFEDQTLKVIVRDSVLDYTQSIDIGLDLDKKTLAHIEQIAQKTVYNAGYDYNVRARVGEFVFPTKEYGNVAFPPGKYNALRIEIGGAKGQNWWCVIYPNICVAGITATLPASSMAQLRHVLSPEEYQLITGESPLRFRLLELFI